MPLAPSPALIAKPEPYCRGGSWMSWVFSPSLITFSPFQTCSPPLEATAGGAAADPFTHSWLSAFFKTRTFQFLVKLPACSPPHLEEAAADGAGAQPLVALLGAGPGEGGAVCAAKQWNACSLMLSGQLPSHALHSRTSQAGKIAKLQIANCSHPWRHSSSQEPQNLASSTQSSKLAQFSSKQQAIG